MPKTWVKKVAKLEKSTKIIPIKDGMELVDIFKDMVVKDNKYCRIIEKDNKKFAVCEISHKEAIDNGQGH